jgi:hypothetical protein
MGLKGAASLARNTLDILAMELPQADALLPELPRSVWLKNPSHIIETLDI